MKSLDWQAGLDPRMVRQFSFLMQADRLKTVIRRNRIADGSRRENTAEHSWHLALLAMVLREWAVGAVDPWRVVRMLVLHDLVEIECGDTVVFDTAALDSQAERERQAADTVFGWLPADQGAEFRALWDEFEAAETPDAKFAKALDRLHPVLMNHAVGGGTWTEYGIDIEWERRVTRRIAEGSPALWDAAESVFADAVAKGWLLPKPAAA